MKKAQVKLIPLHEDDREQFIKDNQWSFKFGSIEEFGLRNDQFTEQGEIISRKTIEDCIDRGELDLLFTLPEAHSKGIGYAAWFEIERLHPEVELWETVTSYFETRNIHFYVNKCGFHIVEYYNPYHLDSRCHDDVECEEEWPEDGGQDPAGGDFRFEKRMK